jgi:hypothetical protein
MTKETKNQAIEVKKELGEMTTEAVAKLETLAKKYIRVGNDYYKIIYRPNHTDKKYKELFKTIKGTIRDDCTGGVFVHIKKYEDFVIKASHTNYEKEIGGFYNRYHELKYKPKEGNCDTIIHTLTHIFGESHLDFALDYLQIIYINPRQRLPIILLESNEKNTGKSTFGTLVWEMFGDNAVKIGNNDLQSDFNSVWVGRVAVIVDETELAKEGIMQMLKRFSTETGKVVINEKNKAQSEVEFIGKFIFMSNSEGKALPIEKGDTRFAVFKVPTFKSKGCAIDPNVVQKIIAEIPAFMHLLVNRTLVHKNNERMYFDTSVYHTKQLDLYNENSVSRLAISIKDLIKDTFVMFPDETELNFSVSNIIDELKGEVRNLARKEIKDAIEKELNIKPKEKGRYTYFSLSEAEKKSTWAPADNSQNNVYYNFNRQYFRS